MKCQTCGADRPKVVETRRLKKTVRRVRRCRECNAVWETVEVILTDKVKRQLKQGRQLNLLEWEFDR